MDGAPRQEPPIAVWSTLRVVLIAGGLLAVLGGRSADPRWVEEVYVRGWGVAVATGLAQASAYAPFGVAEGLIAALIVLEGWLLLSGLSDIAAGRRKALPTALSGLLHLVRATAVILLWFYVAWGAAYARPSAIVRQGWIQPHLDPPAARAQLYAEAAHAVVHLGQQRLGCHHNGALDQPAVDQPRQEGGALDGLAQALSVQG